MTGRGDDDETGRGTGKLTWQGAMAEQGVMTDQGDDDKRTRDDDKRTGDVDKRTGDDDKRRGATKAVQRDDNRDQE